MDNYSIKLFQHKSQFSQSPETVPTGNPRHLAQLENGNPTIWLSSTLLIYIGTWLLTNPTVNAKEISHVNDFAADRSCLHLSTNSWEVVQVQKRVKEETEKHRGSVCTPLPHPRQAVILAQLSSRHL